MADFPPASSDTHTTPVRRSQRNAGWLKTLHLWHWISAALCMLAMALFSVTGITLNHASQIEATPRVSSQKSVLAPAMREAVQAATGQPQLPSDFTDWLVKHWHVELQGNQPEWSDEELYVALPRPGGDAWLRVDLQSGEAEYELTDRGWIAYLNDLHKGRHTGVAWTWFIDIFAALCLVFTLTGLLILKFHAVNRPLTWPMVGLGVLIPALLALLFIH